MYLKGSSYISCNYSRKKMTVVSLWVSEDCLDYIEPQQRSQKEYIFHVTTWRVDFRWSLDYFEDQVSDAEQRNWTLTCGCLISLAPQRLFEHALHCPSQYPLSWCLESMQAWLLYPVLLPRIDIWFDI